MKLSTKQRRECYGTRKNRTSVKQRKTYLAEIRKRREAAEKEAEKAKPRDLGMEVGRRVTVLVEEAVMEIGVDRETAGLTELDVRGSRYDVKGANPSGYQIDVWRKAGSAWGLLQRSQWAGKRLAKMNPKALANGVLGHLNATLAGESASTETLAKGRKKRSGK